MGVSLEDGGEDGVSPDPGIFNINVTPVNDQPDANDDSFTLDEAATFDSNANLFGSLLDNDTDAENDNLTASVVTPPTNGMLTLNSDGTFTYIHNGSETTTDSFTYQISDGNGGLDTAIVNITVNPVNDAPIANPDAYSVDEGQTVTVPVGTGLLSNDTDAEFDPLSATIVADPSHGVVVLNLDGSFTYSHDGSETTTDSFTYLVSDGNAGVNMGTVSLTINPINDAPVAVDDVLIVVEGETASPLAPGVLGNDTDAEGDSLTATIVSGPSNGFATVNPDGSFSYTHDGSETTSDSFTYQVDDGNSSTLAQVNVTVTPVNDAPIVTDANYTVLEGDSLTIGATTGVLATATDAEGDALTATVSTAPLHGSLSLNADGSFTYVHNGSETTSDSFEFAVSDGNGGVVTATAHITVTPDNDAPIGANEDFTTTLGSSLTIAADLGLLANDFDAEGDSLSSILVSGATHGNVTLNPDGSFNYVPEPGFIGIDSFSYVASDGTSTSPPITVLINVGLAPIGGGGDSEGPVVLPNLGDGDDSSDDPIDSTGTPTLLPLNQDQGETSSEPNEIERRPSSAFGISKEIEVQLDGDSRFSQSVSAGSRFSGGITYRIQQELDSVLATLNVNLAGDLYEAELDWQNMDFIRNDLETNQVQRAVNVGAATAIASAATLGYLIWTIRGSQVLMAALLASGPNWRVWDPLPVLAISGGAGGKGDTSLADLAENANKKREEDEVENA